MEEEIFFGTLSIFTFVTLPNGRQKRATLASIPCDYSDRKDVLIAFRMANPSHAEGMYIGARFNFSEGVSD